jgi:CheY-like chemotaxis protein
MLETGGRLTVKLKMVELTLADIPEQKMKPGQYYFLTVSDTGIGMDKNIAERIFDPYFTTKGRERGTGLGLSITYGIVKKYGGTINFYSEPNQGTIFNVYLPAIEKTTELETRDTSPIPKGTERILLVDDDASILMMQEKMLNNLGYRIAAFNRSEDALIAFKAAPHNFDLLLTDMTMPGMTGDKLSVAIHNIRPDIPIIICTGFSEQIDQKKSSDLGIKGFLVKPILRRDLAQKIRQVLDEE